MASAYDKRPAFGLHELVCSMTFHQAEEDVVVCFFSVAVMGGVERNRDHFYIFSSRVVGDIMGVVNYCGPVRWGARSIA